MPTKTTIQVERTMPSQRSLAFSGMRHLGLMTLLFGVIIAITATQTLRPQYTPIFDVIVGGTILLAASTAAFFVLAMFSSDYAKEVKPSPWEAALEELKAKKVISHR